MKKPILSLEDNFKKGKVIKRLNRFTLIVEIKKSPEKVYLRNSGALKTVLKRNEEILIRQVENSERKTNFDAFAIKNENKYVVLDSIFPNKIFPRIISLGYMNSFKGYDSVYSEPRLPDHGRADFRLENKEKTAFVEIKSCTYVNNNIAKFPDRQTERGRKHLKSLKKLVSEETESHILFVVQRPDAEKFQPFREVDPKFARLLREAKESGIKIRAIKIEFAPPKVFLKDNNLKVEM